MRRRRLTRTLAIFFFSYVAAVTGLWAFQNSLVYSPDAIEYLPPSQFAALAGVEEISIETADGVKLRAWYAPAPVGRPTVVMLPGKKSALRGEGNRLSNFIQARMGVLVVAYRGFSGNDGVPSEEGLYSDARAALDWLEQRGVPGSAIAIYGISLGTGVATEMAAERDYAAVVLEAPYTSVVDVAASRFPIVPVRWLMKDRFDSLARIDDLDEPLLIMHGASDRVIPQRLGRALFDAADAPKTGYWPADAGHGDLFDRGGFEAARDFIERTVAARSMVAADRPHPAA